MEKEKLYHLSLIHIFHFSPFTSEWNIEGKSYDKGNVRAYNTYGTSRILSLIHI